MDSFIDLKGFALDRFIFPLFFLLFSINWPYVPLAAKRRVISLTKLLLFINKSASRSIPQHRIMQPRVQIPFQNNSGLQMHKLKF